MSERAVGLLAVHLLGRHVFRRPDHHVRRPVMPLGLDRTGDAEVHDPGVAVAVDHDVLRLEVAMDDAEAVGFGQAFADLAGEADRLADRQAARSGGSGS